MLGREKKNMGREKRAKRRRDLPTKGAAKMRLVSQGVGFWTKHRGEWCVRIAGEFKAGDRVRVMANAGRVTTVVLGEPVPGTRFEWRDSTGERVGGQLFRSAIAAIERLSAEPVPCMMSDLRDKKVTCGYPKGHAGPCSFGRQKFAAERKDVA